MLRGCSQVAAELRYSSPGLHSATVGLHLDAAAMIFDTFFQAAGCVISALLQPRRERPRTPLRSLCVAAFDFSSRVNGQQLGRGGRAALSRLLDLGAD